MYKALCAQQPPVLNNSQLLAIARGEPGEKLDDMM